MTDDQKATNIDLVYNVKHYMMMKDYVSKQLMKLPGYDKETLRKIWPYNQKTIPVMLQLSLFLLVENIYTETAYQ